MEPTALDESEPWKNWEVIESNDVHVYKDYYCLVTVKLSKVYQVAFNLYVKIFIVYQL